MEATAFLKATGLTEQCHVTEETVQNCRLRMMFAKGGRQQDINVKTGIYLGGLFGFNLLSTELEWGWVEIDEIQAILLPP